MTPLNESDKFELVNLDALNGRVGKAIFSNIRHDLRTPLNAIIGYSEIILEECEELSHDNLTNIEFINNGGKELLNLLNDVIGSDRLPDVFDSTGLKQFTNDLQSKVAYVLEPVQQRSSFLLEEPDSLFNEYHSDLENINYACNNMLSLLREIPKILAGTFDAFRITDDTNQPESDKNKEIVEPSALSFVDRIDSEIDTSMSLLKGSILIVDDNKFNRDILIRVLTRFGHIVETAENGIEAIKLIESKPYDLVLLDIMMPLMNGFDVLKYLKSHKTYQHIPIIMISALDELDGVVKCINLGAEDYLAKPFNAVLLRARINASLEKKLFRDMEQRYLEDINREKQKADQLLLNILPAKIADELKAKGKTEPKYLSSVSVMFADFVEFTKITELLSPNQLVGVLHQHFSAFDAIAAKYNLEKLKTNGDSYMAAGGIPEENYTHPIDSILAALHIQQHMKTVNQLAENRDMPKWQLRIGIHTGPLTAGVIGEKKFIYDVWGGTVNIASRLQTTSEPARINISANTKNFITDFFDIEPRGKVAAKHIGELEMFYVNGIKPVFALDETLITPNDKFLKLYQELNDEA